MPPTSATFTVGVSLVLAALAGALFAGSIDCPGVEAACAATKQQSWMLVAMLGVVGVALVLLGSKSSRNDS